MSFTHDLKSKQEHQLQRHQSGKSQPKSRNEPKLSVFIQHISKEDIHFCYKLSQCDGITLPQPKQDTNHLKVDGLWIQTCFECFLMAPDQSYWEYNFSPSKEWNTYKFKTYRTPTDFKTEPPPVIQTLFKPKEFSLTAQIKWPALKVSHWKIAISAVLANHHGDLSYWALNHPTTQPDFHHPDGFVLQVDKYR